MPRQANDRSRGPAREAHRSPGRPGPQRAPEDTLMSTILLHRTTASSASPACWRSSPAPCSSSPGGVTWGAVSTNLDRREHHRLARTPRPSAARPWTRRGRRTRRPRSSTTTRLEGARRGWQADATPSCDRRSDPTARYGRVMNGSFLRASLFTSVVAFGVAALVMGIGVVFGIIGFALRRIAPATDGIARRRAGRREPPRQRLTQHPHEPGPRRGPGSLRACGDRTTRAVADRRRHGQRA